MSTLWLLVKRSLQQHCFSVLITAFTVALASGLLMSIFVIKHQTDIAMTAGATRFDAVLGARGSSLQLVLNTVFHLDVSPGNIPYKLYTTIKNDNKVLTAVPYAVGDNYQGFRIVATTNELFETKTIGKNVELYTGGKFFNPLAPQAVIGSFVAQQTKLKLGDMFNAYHGVVFEEKMKHPDQFKVVGILKPTNTPFDRVIWVPLDSFYRLSGHQLRGTGKDFIANPHEEIPDEHKEVSAVMIKFKNPVFGANFDQTINRQGKVATLAWPIAKVMSDFLNKMGWFHRILTVLAYIIAVIACVSILTGIYNSMNERRRDFAILRSLGARRRHLGGLIIAESTLIATLGVVVGFFIYGLITGVAAFIIRSSTGVVIDVFAFDLVFIVIPILIVFLGSLAGVIPAIKAYRVQVADNLIPQT